VSVSVIKGQVLLLPTSVGIVLAHIKGNESARRSNTFFPMDMAVRICSGKDLDIPENFDVLAMIAIGRKAPREHLLPQLQEREYPSDRKPLKDIVMEGKFVK
jgi:hypothetical protein